MYINVFVVYVNVWADNDKIQQVQLYAIGLRRLDRRRSVRRGDARAVGARAYWWTDGFVYFGWAGKLRKTHRDLYEPCEGVCHHVCPADRTEGRVQSDPDLGFPRSLPKTLLGCLLWLCTANSLLS